MIGRCLRGVLPVILATLAACAAPSVPDGAQMVRRATRPGAEVRVASFGRMNEACQQVGLATATITTPPPHGTLTVRTAVLTMGGRVYSGSARCRDAQVPGIELWYASAPDFRGTDRMEYRVDAGQGPIAFVATVDVR